MLTGHGSIETAIQAMRQGAYDYLTKPFQLPELEVHVQKAYEKVRLARRERQRVEQLRYESPRYQLVGSGPAMQRVLRLMEKVAPTDSTVLIRGASGTGKELVARALHLNSPRRERPLIPINCAALQETLLESELFGHEKGAFTGAVQAKPGLFEVAEGSTLFIDEIAEMAPGLQAKLLRVLEDGHFRRVGGTQELQAGVRVVAATNRPLEEEMRAGRFREDLYYRLNVIAIGLPPLRDRPRDIPELVEHFLTTRPVGPTRCRIDPGALAVLSQYAWPGNVRERANVLERAQILAEGHVITLDDLPDSVVDAAPQVASGAEPGHLREVERRLVQEVLEQHQGNKVQAARTLGISRRALYRLITKYGLGGRPRRQPVRPPPAAPQSLPSPRIGRRVRWRDSRRRVSSRRADRTSATWRWNAVPKRGSRSHARTTSSTSRTASRTGVAARAVAVIARMPSIGDQPRISPGPTRWTSATSCPDTGTSRPTSPARTKETNGASCPWRKITAPGAYSFGRATRASCSAYGPPSSCKKGILSISCGDIIVRPSRRAIGSGARGPAAPVRCCPTGGRLKAFPVPAPLPLPKGPCTG
jgi:DNA-binding NtrC family response regulator